MSADIIGHIHSTESLGTVDGPGLRFVVFLEGCPMRCAYCHNPDTWDKNAGTEMTVGEIVEQFDRVKEFLRGGGITCTGGEPLVQAEFVAELFSEMKRRGVHTCLDTSGIVWKDESRRQLTDRVLDNTDLVMLDIKHIDPEKHKWLTGQDNAAVKDFALHLSERGIPVWIRHVLVPTVTDDEASLTELGRFIARIKTLKALDVLPYHTMGVGKYKELGISYRLEGVPPADKAQAAKARDIIFAGLKQQLREDIKKSKDQ